jgi:hypothetical protein
VPEPVPGAPDRKPVQPTRSGQFDQSTQSVPAPRARWATEQSGWFGASQPLPSPLLAVLGAAGLLALIPVAFRAPPLAASRDVWNLFDSFGLAFLALPVTIAALLAGNALGPLRDGLAGCAVGTSMIVLGDLGLVREAAGADTLRTGWWLLAIGAFATVLTIGAWRGYCARWRTGQWLGLALIVLGLGVVTFGRIYGGWHRAPDPAGPSDGLALAVAALLALATLFRPAGGARFLIALASCGVLVLEMFAFVGDRMAHRWAPDGILFADTLATVIALVGLGVITDRGRDRLFLLTARVAAACALLRPLVPAGPLTDRAHLHLIAFVIIAVAALAGFRRVARLSVEPDPPSNPWAPPTGPSYRS